MKNNQVMLCRTDPRFQIRVEERADGKKQFVVWFSEKKLGTFTMDEYSNAKYFAERFINNCLRYGYADNEMLKNAEPESLPELFKEIDRREVDYWQHRDEVAQYFDHACNIFANYGIKINDFDKLDKFFAEED